MKLPSVKMEWKTSPQPTSRSTFCMMTANFEMTHSYVTCREELCKYLWMDMQANSPRVYMDKTRFMYANDQHLKYDDQYGLDSYLDFLHQMDGVFGMAKTKVYTISNPRPHATVFIIDGSPKWMISPPMFSLFAMFVRIGSCHKAGDSYQKTFERISASRNTGMPITSNGNDSGYVPQMQTMIDRHKKYGFDKLFYPQRSQNFAGNPVGTLGFHNYVGNNYDKIRYPKWESALKS